MDQQTRNALYWVAVVLLIIVVLYYFGLIPVIITDYIPVAVKQYLPVYGATPVAPIVSPVAPVPVAPVPVAEAPAVPAAEAPPKSGFGSGLSVNGVPGRASVASFDYATTAQIVADSTTRPQYSITGLPLRDGTWNNYPVPLSYAADVSGFGNIPSADVLDTLQGAGGALPLNPLPHFNTFKL